MIAAGSIVTKDIPPYAIVAGVPAKIIRYRFSADKIEKLLILQWWNMPLSELRKNKAFFRAGKDWYKYFPTTQMCYEEKAA